MIIVFGSINVDLLFRMREAPVLGQTLLADDLAIQPGGKGANQAVAAALDGAEVRMIGAVGDDPLAAAALGGLTAAGVGLAGICTCAGATTGCASICTDHTGGNQIAVALGANMLLHDDQLEGVPLAPGTTVLLQMEADPAVIARVIGRARQAGCRVILNLAPAVQLAPDVLRQLDILVVNKDEATILGETLSCAADAGSLHRMLGSCVIRTLGAEGAEAATNEGLHRYRARTVQAVDTTAAGDCFVGVLAAALDRGVGLEQAMTRACAAAALACTVAGSQQSLPRPASIDAMLLASD